jgi:hypothetical protein
LLKGANMSTVNYSESTISGTSWKRISRIQIDNPRPPLIPSMMMVEDEVVNIGVKEISTRVANLSCQFDPADPDDLMLYDLLNKKYVKLREARDAAVITETTEVTV